MLILSSTGKAVPVWEIMGGLYLWLFGDIMLAREGTEQVHLIAEPSTESQYQCRPRIAKLPGSDPMVSRSSWCYKIRSLNEEKVERI